MHKYITVNVCDGGFISAQYYMHALHALSREGPHKCVCQIPTLCSLRSEDDRRLSQWVKQKTDKYTSPDIQNEMVKVMATRILRNIASDLQNSPFYTIMLDETADVANIEQVVVCFRWVSDRFEAHEEFVGRQYLRK